MKTFHRCKIDGNFDFIIDFLRILHQPPPPHVENLEDFAKYIWDYAVVTLGFSRGAARVTIVIDKPQYLPPPRALLHTSRQKKLGVSATSKDVEFPDATGPLPHGKDYACSLSQPHFKAKLIAFVTKTFLKFASERLVAEQSILIDSPAIETPLLLLRNKQSVAQQLNQKGEKDHGVWYHAARSPISNAVVYACDTDIWMTGVALAELGHLHGKSVFVELRQSEQYVNVTKCNNVLHAHPSLQKLRFAASCLLAAYVLSGTDYVSSYFGVSHQAAVRSFCRNAIFICSHESLVAFRESPGQPTQFKSLSLPACAKFIACIYYDRHKQFLEAKQHMSCPFQSRSLQYLMKCL